MNTLPVKRIPSEDRRQRLQTAAEFLSPGMARSLEKLLAAYLTGAQVEFTAVDNAMLTAAACAIATVNRTPGAAVQIGRAAAGVVAKNPDSAKLIGVAHHITRRIA